MNADLRCLSCGGPGARVYFDHGDDGPYCVACANDLPSGVTLDKDPDEVEPEFLYAQGDQPKA